jgi:hypothetical protein
VLGRLARRVQLDSLGRRGQAAAQRRGPRQQAGLAKRVRALSPICARLHATSAAGSAGPTVRNQKLLLSGERKPWGAPSRTGWARALAALTASAPHGRGLRPRRQRQNGAPSANAAGLAPRLA